MADRQVTALCAMSPGCRGSGRSTRNERRATPRSARIAGRGDAAASGTTGRAWEAGGPCLESARVGRRRASEREERPGREWPGSWGKLSQRQRSRDNPAGRPTSGMTVTRPPRHVTIPQPRGVT